MKGSLKIIGIMIIFSIITAGILVFVSSFFSPIKKSKSTLTIENFNKSSKIWVWCEDYKKYLSAPPDVFIVDYDQASKGYPLCYFDVAISYGNQSLCEKISDKNLKNFCFAITKNDKSFCEKTNSSERICCNQILQYITKQNPELCNFLSESCRFSCYWVFALLKKDEKICNKLNSLSPKLVESCKVEVAMAKKDPSICNDLDIYHKLACFDVFLKTDEEVFQNASICEKIRDEEYNGMLKRTCYHKVALYQKNPSLCYKAFKHEDMLNWCLAQVYSNPEYCEKIKDKFDKELCIESLQKERK